MIKDLGQNFLVDRQVLAEIITAADLTRDDVVLEIGPGKGVLTEELAGRVKKVIAVELDRGLVALLQKKFVRAKNVTIIHEDILQWRPAEILKDFKVVANLPYGITSRVLRMMLESEQRPSLMVVMIQKEVAERICAAPGDMSMLSVSVQYYAKSEIVRVVPPTAFDPSPTVDSAVLKIMPFAKRSSDPVFEKNFFRIVKIGFSSRRKQLQNLLASELQQSNEAIKNVLQSLGFSSTVRAQELSVEAWIALTERLFSA